MSPLPDLQGFVDAEQRLRDLMGVDATFRVPQQPTWDAAEPIDPETQRPYDPFAVPTSGGDFDDVVIRVLKIARPITRQGEDQTVVGPPGRMPAGTEVLSISPDDFPRITDATEVIVRGERWKIAQVSADSRARYLIYVERT